MNAANVGGEIATARRLFRDTATAPMLEHGFRIAEEVGELFEEAPADSISEAEMIMDKWEVEYPYSEGFVRHPGILFGVLTVVNARRSAEELAAILPRLNENGEPMWEGSA